MKFQKKIKKIVKRLSKKHRVEVIYKWKDNSGTAFHDERKVKVPKHLDSPEKALTCLHEIGHIVIGDRHPSYYDEYLAERYAIRTGNKYGIRSEDYECNAKLYVMWHICDNIKKKKVALGKVRQSVIDFVSDVYDFDGFRKKLKKGYVPYHYEWDKGRFTTKWYKKRKKARRGK